MCDNLKTGISYVDELAKFTHELSFDDIPENVIKKVKLLTLDTMGIMLYASGENFAKIMADVVLSWGGRPESTVVGFGNVIPSPNAALINCTMAHGLDYDDTHLGSVVHTSAPIVPSALAAGEREGIDGEKLITAMVAGYEISTRLGITAYNDEKGHSGFHLSGFHATAVCGTYGAAAIGGKIYNLKPEEIVTAIGICSSITPGGCNTLGGEMKKMHPGWAAHSGLVASQLGKGGFSGSNKVNIQHLYEAYISENLGYHPEKLIKGLGNIWETSNIFFKPYPCCAMLTSPMDAALYLKKKYQINPDSIDKVFVGMPEASMHMVCEPAESKKHPSTPYESQFSLHWGVAAILLDGQAGVQEFSAKKLRDQYMHKLTEKIEYFADGNKYDEASIKINMMDGKVYEHKVSTSRGGPDLPLTDEEIEEKYRVNALKILSENKVEKILHEINNLEDINNVRELMKLCKK
jgi:2-methylcitrate dehydratase PrpD